jgi:sRNA-binding protein
VTSGGCYRTAIRMRNVLAERFPEAFVAKGDERPKQPLKRGIHADIMREAPDLDRKQVIAALAHYTRTTGYIEAVADGRDRIDLDGHRVGHITPGHADHARRLLARRAQQNALRIAAPADSRGLEEAQAVA